MRARVPLLAATLASWVLALALPLALRAGEETPDSARAAPAIPSNPAFDRLKLLVGEWVVVEGSFGKPGEVAVRYALTGAGSALVETLFPGAEHEMVTVYHRDGEGVVLTHYCAAGNQPRMRLKSVEGGVFAFDYDGGTNIVVERDSHMHSAKLDLSNPDEIRSEWIGWTNGKPDPEHAARFRLTRKKS